MKPKPRHLGPEYGSQWQDRSMAAAYQHRPPYPALVFEVLKRIAKPGPVLEIGAGSGDATLELAWRFDRIDAIEPSAAMLAMAARRTGRNIRWIQSSFEDAELSPPYGLAVAAESLHWTNWSVSLPKIADALAPGAVLALIERITVETPWTAELANALERYSTNKLYEPYDLVEELRARRLFRVTGGTSTLRERRAVTIEDYIEGLHSRNGLSRDRMPAADADAFDAAIRATVQPHLKDELVPLATYAQLTWGIPMP
ncbi:MAG: class I SAM-dependent methyltransferase [Planctomycetes bacterium]|nr:class I SAM-dependent methyltransferase [Planctomycetota bacterium]